MNLQSAGAAATAVVETFQAVRERTIAKRDEALRDPVVEPWPLDYSGISSDAINKTIHKSIAYSGVTFEEVMGRSRLAKVARVRHRAMADVVREHPWISYVRLGYIFGRDHTTCLYALEKLGAKPVREKGQRGGEAGCNARIYGERMSRLFAAIGALPK